MTSKNPILMAAVLVAVLGSSVIVGFVPASDAFTDFTLETSVEVNDDFEIDISQYNINDRTKVAFGNKDAYGEYPDGITLSITDGKAKMSGNVTNVGKYQFVVAFCGGWFGTIEERLFVTLNVTEHNLQLFTVTYHADIGLVNGQSEYKEQITEGTYASLPDAEYSNGAYTFKGWSLSRTSSVPVTSFIVNGNTDLYAIWQKNSINVTDGTATISQGQSSSVLISTNPSNAFLSISDYGGLKAANVKVEGHNILLDMTDVEPGTYYVTLTASYSGYYNGTSTVTVKVPITIVKPVEYNLSQGEVFSYTPVTNPSNASIEITSVKLDGTVKQNHGLTVSGRTITGTMTDKGLYEISYKATMQGYESISNTVVLNVRETPSGQTFDPVDLRSISFSQRANEPLVYDLSVIGSNISNYVWTLDGEIFASSSSNAIVELPSAGLYRVGCTGYGLGGDSMTVFADIVCKSNAHNDMAWVGVPYSYIVDGRQSCTVPSDSPFTASVETVGGKEYTIISGTPSQDDSGKRFHLVVGQSAWDVNVGTASTSAPVADFTMELDGKTLTVTFTGSGATQHRFDFNGDGVFDEGNSYQYLKSGRYIVTCKAINNVSEVSVSKYIDVEIPEHRESVALGDLTDFSMKVGEKLSITIDMSTEDVLGASGPAASFVTIEGKKLIIEPTQAGEYQLQVSVAHDASMETEEISITVTDGSTPEPKDNGYRNALLVFFVVALLAIGGFITIDRSNGRRGLR